MLPKTEEPTHWKRPWCWERLQVRGEGDDRGWDGWMASLTWWTWVWVGSGSWWWTEKPGMLQSTGSQRIRHDWATELNWGHLGGPYPRISVLMRRDQDTDRHRGKTLWRYRKETATYKPKGEALGRKQTLDLGLPFSRTVFLFFKPPSLWCFVMVKN